MDIDIEMENLKYLLNTNQIDPHEYSYRVQELMSNRKKEKKKSTKMAAKGIGVDFFIIGIILFWVLFWWDSTYVSKEFEEVVDLRNLSDPIQIACKGSTIKEVDGANVKLEHLAEYKIQARVVDVQDYVPYDLGDELSPVDFGLAWGYIARDENIEKLEFKSKGTRFLSYNTADRGWLANNGGWDEVGKYISNNHIIPANEDIEKAVKAVKTGEYVELTGYLVRATCSNPSFRWTSSLTRNDDGAGACEVFLVEDVKWLKEAEN